MNGARVHPGQGSARGPRELVRDVVLASGLRWEGYRRKWRTVWPAVRSAVEESGSENLEVFLESLRRDPALRRALRPGLGVTVSRFFRGARSFETLARSLVAELPPEGEVRAWSAGCACGEEPYALAIVWEERIRPVRPSLLLRVLATDLREDCLERARQGVYPPSSLRNLPAGAHDRYFERGPSGYHFRLPAGVVVEFRPGDLLEDPPPAGCRLALCRNAAFTYFGPEGQERAWRALARALLPGGTLLIGEHETLPRAALRRPGQAEADPAARRPDDPAEAPAVVHGWGAFEPVAGDRTVFLRVRDIGHLDIESCG